MLCSLIWWCSHHQSTFVLQQCLRCWWNSRKNKYDEWTSRTPHSRTHSDSEWLVYHPKKISLNLLTKAISMWIVNFKRTCKQTQSKSFALYSEMPQYTKWCGQNQWQNVLSSGHTRIVIGCMQCSLFSFNNKWTSYWNGRRQLARSFFWKNLLALHNQTASLHLMQWTGMGFCRSFILFAHFVCNGQLNLGYYYQIKRILIFTS